MEATKLLKPLVQRVAKRLGDPTDKRGVETEAWRSFQGTLAVKQFASEAPTDERVGNRIGST
ncbi:MAG: hypothetical protein DMG51_14840 [Acidobacteria bacterium]|nr:MAG: hypothetical protein DMG51_14840 [Acidobacteriota bacterium]